MFSALLNVTSRNTGMKSIQVLGRERDIFMGLQKHKIEKNPKPTQQKKPTTPKTKHYPLCTKKPALTQTQIQK